jgi:hypothetical protein
MQLFETEDGRIQYDNMPDNYKYEFEYPSSSFWNQTPTWIYIAEIRAQEKFKNKGATLLEEFISILPPNTGIVLNAVPLDDNPTFSQLQAWYKKRGFKEINEHNISLYLITGN